MSHAEARPLWVMFLYFTVVALPVTAVLSLVSGRPEPVIGAFIACSLLVGVSALCEWFGRE